DGPFPGRKRCDDRSLARLSGLALDVLFVQAVRAWGEKSSLSLGWLTGLTDRPRASRDVLFGQRNRRVRPVRHHIDIVDLRDELGFRVPLRVSHHLGEFRIVGPGLQPPVTLLFRRITPNIDERVLRTDTEFGVAFLRYPIAHVGDPMSREDRRRPAGEPLRQRIPLSRQRSIDAQLIEPRCSALLRVAPGDSCRAESYSENRSDLPFQHASLLV